MEVGPASAFCFSFLALGSEPPAGLGPFLTSEASASQAGQFGEFGVVVLGCRFFRGFTAGSASRQPTA